MKVRLEKKKKGLQAQLEGREFASLGARIRQPGARIWQSRGENSLRRPGARICQFQGENSLGAGREFALVQGENSPVERREFAINGRHGEHAVPRRLTWKDEVYRQWCGHTVV